MFGRISGKQEYGGDCADGAGMRPRCDLLRKDSGKDVQSYSSAGVAAEGQPCLMCAEG